MTQESKRKPISIKAVLDLTATIAIIAAAGVMVWVNLIKIGPVTTETPLPTSPLSLEGASVLGAKDAKIAIVEYSDFECPSCRKFNQEDMPAIRTEYIDTGKVLFAFRHFPLQKLHRGALAAAKAAHCAGEQGRFWEIQDQLFARNPGEALTGEGAAKMGLDQRLFVACVESSGAESSISKDIQGATKLRISGTPAFFIGAVEPGGRVRVVRVFSGARRLADFSAAIEEVADAQNSHR